MYESVFKGLHNASFWEDINLTLTSNAPEEWYARLEWNPAGRSYLHSVETFGADSALSAIEDVLLQFCTSKDQIVKSKTRHRLAEPSAETR